MWKDDVIIVRKRKKNQFHCIPFQINIIIKNLFKNKIEKWEKQGRNN